MLRKKKMLNKKKNIFVNLQKYMLIQKKCI